MTTQNTSNSFYWFDYETFGTHPAWDRPCQFAGVRTDMQLNEIEEPSVFFCRQSMDYLPNPIACKVTGLSPQRVNAKGVSESEFIAQILEHIGKPGTCSVGYNNIRFDDEVTRHTLFRNYFDAYEHEYKNGNSRWDLLDVVRLTRALRPDGINWPSNDDGSPSNRLEDLSTLNNIEHGHAHDALSDVRATIGMARLIRHTQPKLFDFAFANRSKQAVSERLNVRKPQKCLLVAGTIPGARSHLTVILPLAIHPEQRNNVIVLDLQQDPSALLDMTADDIASRLFNKQGLPRPGLMSVKINKCPVVMPFNVLRETDAARLEIDLGQVNQHAEIAKALLTSEMKNKLVQAMTTTWPNEPQEIEGTLYSGSFLSFEDKKRAMELRTTKSPESILNLASQFDDSRLKELAFRYQARNFPESLTLEQKLGWREFCHDRLDNDAAPWLTVSQFDQIMKEADWPPQHKQLQEDLLAYREVVCEHMKVTEPELET